LYVYYQKELVNYKNNLAMLKEKNGKEIQETTIIPPLLPADVTLFAKPTSVKLAKGISIYSDIDSKIEDIAPELIGMNGWILNANIQSNKGTTVEFETTAPVKILVGYFRDDQKKFAKAPTLETDASANLFGQSEPVLINAIRFNGLPVVNVHAYSFNAGKNKLLLPKGLCLLLGFTNSMIETRNAGLAGTGKEETMDWMFY